MVLKCKSQIPVAPCVSSVMLDKTHPILDWFFSSVKWKNTGSYLELLVVWKDSRYNQHLAQKHPVNTWSPRSHAGGCWCHQATSSIYVSSARQDSQFLKVKELISIRQGMQ